MAQQSAKSKLPENVRQRPLRFQAEDGCQLGGTLFEGSGDGPALLVSSATAVPQGFYAAFASAAVSTGARAVLTYDYRGTGASQPARGYKQKMLMRHWALLDFPAAIRALEVAAPGGPVVGLGQSFGGHALGLSGMDQHFERYAMVSALSGWFGGLDDQKSAWLMRAVGVPVSMFTPTTPRWLGTGDPIPGPVFREWAYWCSKPNYFFDDPTLPETKRFASVRTPLLSIRCEDDKWGTKRAVEALLAWYSAAPIERAVVDPSMVGGQPIGHLGFFRSRFAETLWPPLIGWLLEKRPYEV